MILYHASKEVVEFPEIRKTRYTKDFSWGFYCTNNLEQAIRWANRGEGTPLLFLVFLAVNSMRAHT